MTITTTPCEILFAVTFCNEDGEISTEFHTAESALEAAFKHTCVRWASLDECNAEFTETGEETINPEDFDLEVLQEILRSADCLLCVVPVPQDS